MSSDSMSNVLMTTIRCVMAVIVNWRNLKFLAFSGYVLICAMIFMMQPIRVQTSGYIEQEYFSG